MADEGKLRSQQERAKRARRILDDELFRETLDRLDQDIVALWRNSAIDEDQKRQDAYRMQLLLRNLRDQFTRMIVSGEAAGKELLRVQQESTLKRLFHGRR